MTVTVPATPMLGRVPGVELLHVGDWDISTGTVHVSLDDMTQMVAAVECPAVRNATCKPGHQRPMMVGDPAIGYVDNLRVEDDYKLVGDLCGLPGWLTERNPDGDSVLASAYADRSCEWAPWVCQLGHTHPQVLGAVAFLGVEHPGIGTLESLHDLYATPPAAANAAATPTPGDIMPVPNAATVSTDQIRRAYYDASGWDEWIVEMHLDPLQLIVVDDGNGKYYRVPITVNGDDVTFEQRTEVRVEYVDAAAKAAAVAAGRKILYATRDESRPHTTPTESAGQKAASGPTEGSPGMDPAKLREQVGLPADAPDNEVSEKLAELMSRPTEPAPVVDPTVPAGVDVEAVAAAAAAKAVEAAVKPYREELNAATTELASIKKRDADDTKARVMAAAVASGKITPAEREAWAARYDKAPDLIADILDAKAAGSAVPVHAAGYTAGDPSTVDGLTDEDNKFLASLGGGA